jgi:hypothetical protein
LPFSSYLVDVLFMMQDTKVRYNAPQDAVFSIHPLHSHIWPRLSFRSLTKHITFGFRDFHLLSLASEFSPFLTSANFCSSLAHHGESTSVGATFLEEAQGKPDKQSFHLIVRTFTHHHWYLMGRALQECL